MAIHIQARAERIDTQIQSTGDYVLCEDAPRADQSLPWQVTLVENPAERIYTLLGRFPSKANALTFVLSHQSTGWEDGGTLRSAALDILRCGSDAELQQATRRLGYALIATAQRRPRVLVVIDRGIATVHTTTGVDAVVVNVDNQREFAPHELLPVHTDYRALLATAKVHWPTSPVGRRREPHPAARSQSPLPTMRLVKTNH